jgi:glycosyltransferase involved in cell wall biosynthesis
MNRLVYILPRYDPETTKHYYYEYKLIEALAENNDIRVIIEKGCDMGIEETYCQRFSFPPFRALELLAVLLAWRLDGYTTTYTHYSYYGGIIGGVVSTLFGGRSYYWNCSMMHVFNRDSLYSLSGMKNRLRGEWPMRVSLALSDRLVTGTETMVEYYCDEYGLDEEAVVELANWVDLDRFDSLPTQDLARGKHGLPRDRPIVLYLHKLGVVRGADEIPDIAAATLEAVPDALFVVVGGGWYREELEAEVERRGLGDSVRFEGWVPNDAAIEYFRAADVYMLPSRAEGFPRVVLEAMAADCAIVSTDAGGVPDILPASYQPYVSTVGDTDTFVDNLVTVLTDSECRASLVESGNARVQEYTRADVCEAMEERVLGSDSA